MICPAVSNVSCLYRHKQSLGLVSYYLVVVLEVSRSGIRAPSSLQLKGQMH